MVGGDASIGEGDHVVRHLGTPGRGTRNIPYVDAITFAIRSDIASPPGASKTLHDPAPRRYRHARSSWLDASAIERRRQCTPMQVHDGTKPLLVIVSGAPATGKTTL